MGVQWHREKLKFNAEGIGLLVDVLMILLVIVNLGLILFDWVFSAQAVQQGLARVAPDFTAFYAETIHADFIFWDMIFVGIYLTEFGIRWAIAALRHTYHRWFFYPFIHWYDLLGCIPVGGFRWLRILRVISLLHRLQRTGIIDLRYTWLGLTVLKYYRIVVEEVSDRVVINVLDGVQREIRQGTPLIHRIETEVLAPRRDELVDLVASRLVGVIARTHSEWREGLGGYLSQLTDDAVARTPSGARLAAIPVAGPRALALLGDTVRELGVALTDQLVEDLTNPANRDTLDSLIDGVIRHAAGDRDQLDRLIRDTLIDILDQVKAQVAVQHWKQAEAEA
ncbi:MAG: ion transporter [Alcanivoracaceae bacterium]